MLLTTWRLHTKMLSINMVKAIFQYRNASRIDLKAMLKFSVLLALVSEYACSYRYMSRHSQ